MARRLAEWEGMRLRWDGISDDEWQRASGDRQQIIALLERRNGWTRDQAEAELDRFLLERESALAGTGAVVTGDANVRAQPGDVLGLDTGGEVTSIGDSAEDEDERRIAAERAVRGAGRD
jgi:hypothetical protein